MAQDKDQKPLNVPPLRFPGFTDEWKKTTLGEIGETMIGLTYSPKDVVENGGTIVFRSSNIQNGMIDYSDLVRVTKPIKERIITKEKDILICARNGSQRLIGKNTLLRESDAGNTFGAFMMVYRSDDNDIIHPLLSTKQYVSQVTENLGARINQITTSDLNSFEFFLPQESEEKRKIGELFALINERIATQNKIIDNLQSLIKGLNDSFHDNKQGEAISFDELGHSYSGLSGKSGDDFGQGSPYITYLNVFQNNVANEEQLGLVSVDENESQNTISYGDVLFTLSSETPEETGIGCVYLGKSGKYYLNSFCFGVRITQSNKVYPPYLAHLVSSSQFRRFVYPLAQGSTRFNLQKNDFMKKKFILLPIEKQKEISKTLDALHDKLSVEFKLLGLYSKQKAYLLRSMFI